MTNVAHSLTHYLFSSWGLLEMLFLSKTQFNDALIESWPKYSPNQVIL